MWNRWESGSATDSAEGYDGNDDSDNVADEPAQDADDDWLNSIKPSSSALRYVLVPKEGCLGQRTRFNAGA
jgi:hypothetical protein